jgi:hypothetical protein
MLLNNFPSSHLISESLFASATISYKNQHLFTQYFSTYFGPGSPQYGGSCGPPFVLLGVVLSHLVPEGMKQ